MITVTKTAYERDYPDWVTKCPICNDEELDATIELSSESLNHVRFAIGKNCREELAKKLFKPDGEQK